VGYGPQWAELYGAQASAGRHRAGAPGAPPADPGGAVVWSPVWRVGLASSLVGVPGGASITGPTATGEAGVGGAAGPNKGLQPTANSLCSAPAVGSS